LSIFVIVIPLIEMYGCDWFKSRHVVWCKLISGIDWFTGQYRSEPVSTGQYPDHLIEVMTDRGIVR